MNEYDVGGVELDAADWRLLEQLQQDASLTNQALAERCHISPPTCLRRVRRLQALGLIERTVSILGGDALRALTGAGLPVDPPRDFATPRGLPTTYLLAPDGRVAHHFLGPVTAADLEAAIAAGGEGAP